LNQRIIEYKAEKVTDIHPIQVARFLEGFLYGILDMQFHELHKCLGDVGTLQSDLYLALHDFEE
jgi:hypothetical protein